MKKRNVALVLAATMMLSLAGCAGSNEKTEDTKKAQTETENKTEGKEDTDWTVPGEAVEGEDHDEYHVDDNALYEKIIETFYKKVSDPN